MADKKISALSAASLPLAGTEVLPIVQSGTTVKVASDDLTVKNIRSNATTGLLQVTGPAASATRVMTTPDANFSVARIDAAQSFTGDQTLATGNLVIGTAGKGIDFSADPSAPGMISELLNDYETGTWTPAYATTGTQFTSVTYAGVTGGKYTKVGNKVFIQGVLRTDAITVGSASGNIIVTGLPFAVAASTGSTANGNSSISVALASAFTSNPPIAGPLVANNSQVTLYAALNGGPVTVADMGTGASANSLRFSGTYITN